MIILTIVGARPQLIKSAVVSRTLRQTHGVREVLVHTGQHYDRNLSDVFFAELRLRKPDYSLGIRSGTHGAQTGRMLEAIERVLLREKPDVVVVYGDTNSTLAGALAAAKLHVRLAHVEAGLRSGNRLMAEEQNRVLTDHLADVLFCPDRRAATTLRAEGIPQRRIRIVGDVLYDAATLFGETAERLTPAWSLRYSRRGLPDRFILATIHRAENTDDPVRLRGIFTGLARAARACPIVLPLHPRTRKMLSRERWSRPVLDALVTLPPVSYLEMLWLERHAALAVTDSGGVQREAFFFGVPCIVLRTETEWALGSGRSGRGGNHLVASSDPEAIARCIARGLRAPARRRASGRLRRPNAAQKVARMLIDLAR